MMADSVLLSRVELQAYSSQLAAVAGKMDHFDGFDPYGSSLAIAFDICEILYSRGADIPDEWEYRHGARSSELNVEEISHHELIDRETSYLLYVGGLAVDLADRCRLLGLDY